MKGFWQSKQRGPLTQTLTDNVWRASLREQLHMLTHGEGHIAVRGQHKLRSIYAPCDEENAYADEVTSRGMQLAGFMGLCELIHDHHFGIIHVARCFMAVPTDGKKHRYIRGLHTHVRCERCWRLYDTHSYLLEQLPLTQVMDNMEFGATVRKDDEGEEITSSYNDTEVKLI